MRRGSRGSADSSSFSCHRSSWKCIARTDPLSVRLWSNASRRICSTSSMRDESTDCPCASRALATVSAVRKGTTCPRRARAQAISEHVSVWVNVTRSNSTKEKSEPGARRTAANASRQFRREPANRFASLYPGPARISFFRPTDACIRRARSAAQRKGSTARTAIPDGVRKKFASEAACARDGELTARGACAGSSSRAPLPVCGCAAGTRVVVARDVVSLFEMDVMFVVPGCPLGNQSPRSVPVGWLAPRAASA